MRILFRLLLLFTFALGCAFAVDNHAQKVTFEDSYLSYNNIWFKALKNYKDYEKLQNKAVMIESVLKEQSNLQQRTKYQEELSVIKNNLKLYEYNEKPPFFELFIPLENVLKKINTANITITSIFSDELDTQVRRVQNLMQNYEKEYLDSIEYINGQLANIDTQNLSSDIVKNYKNSLQNDKELMSISLDSLKRVDEQILKEQERYYENLDSFKSTELHKFFYIAISILILYSILTLIKLYISRKSKDNKSEEDEQKYYTVKKLLNILFVVISLLILAFSYVDNVTQALAVFGVIGAGLTIVMKEWVLSFIGWVVLMFTNSIKIGDRIRIDKDGKPIIGDVIDISLTKLTLYENITNDALNTHKRAGRIIFIPNYFLITNEVYNYTHYSLKTILDTIEFNITFDSNLEKAEAISLEVANSITSRYTDMAKRQYDALKGKYTLRNMPNYPRVFFYPSNDNNGITIGLWYVTPYREILRLKSEMTKELTKKLLEQQDIKLLYSAKTMFVEKLPRQ